MNSFNSILCPSDISQAQYSEITEIHAQNLLALMKKTDSSRSALEQNHEITKIKLNLRRRNFSSAGESILKKRKKPLRPSSSLLCSSKLSGNVHSCRHSCNTTKSTSYIIKENKVESFHPSNELPVLDKRKSYFDEGIASMISGGQLRRASLKSLCDFDFQDDVASSRIPSDRLNKTPKRSKKKRSSFCSLFYDIGDDMNKKSKRGTKKRSSLCSILSDIGDDDFSIPLAELWNEDDEYDEEKEDFMIGIASGCFQMNSKHNSKEKEEDLYLSDPLCTFHSPPASKKRKRLSLTRMEFSM